MNTKIVNRIRQLLGRPTHRITLRQGARVHVPTTGATATTTDRLTVDAIPIHNGRWRFTTPDGQTAVVDFRDVALVEPIAPRRLATA